MNADLIVLADMANIDAGGKLNIIGEFNTVRARQIPSDPLRVVLVARIVAESSEGVDHDIQIVIVDQDGNELSRLPKRKARFSRTMPGTSGDLRAQIVLWVEGLRFPSYGTFRFDVLVDDRYIGGRSLFVVQQQSDEQTEDKA
jgi:hypothetical protein